MLTWPFRSIARQREHLLGLRIKDLEAQLVTERGYAAYFRDRYERLADLMLVRQVAPNAVAQVHVDKPAPSSQETLGPKIARVANLVGNARGIKVDVVKPHASAAELPEV